MECVFPWGTNLAGSRNSLQRWYQAGVYSQGSGRHEPRQDAPHLPHSRTEVGDAGQHTGESKQPHGNRDRHAGDGPRARHMRAGNDVISAVNRVMMTAVGGAKRGVSGGTEGLEGREIVPDMAPGSPVPGGHERSPGQAHAGQQRRHQRRQPGHDDGSGRRKRGVSGATRGLEGRDTMPDMAPGSPGPGGHERSPGLAHAGHQRHPQRRQPGHGAGSRGRHRRRFRLHKRT